MRKFGKILVALVLMLGLGLLVGCSCEKEKVLEGITVTPASLTLDSSKMQVLEVKPVPADAELPSVEFISSDSRIASVGKDGKVMGLRAGTAEITVKVGEFTKKVTVTVNPVMPTSLTLSKEEVTLKVGEKIAITYKVEPQDTTDQVAVFASDNEAIATVSAEGEITAVAEGETVVKVSLGGLEEEVAVTV
ncbi:MAG TPA: Ig-like domain-containing protein, partial [Bacilli bacterium]|nr:Ig-like domain-containing protein [Bacilli bacterium]